MRYRRLMRALLVVVVLFVSSCGAKAKPAAEPETGSRGRMTVTETTVEVIDYVYFEPGSSEVGEDQNATLDAVASTLEQNKGITKVEVQGFADASEADPTALSQARAEAVLASLVSKGTAAERLVAKGYATDTAKLTDDPDQQPKTKRIVGFLILERLD